MAGEDPGVPFSASAAPVPGRSTVHHGQWYKCHRDGPITFAPMIDLFGKTSARPTAFDSGLHAVPEVCFHVPARTWGNAGHRWRFLDDDGGCSVICAIDVLEILEGLSGGASTMRLKPNCCRAFGELFPEKADSFAREN